MRVSNVILLATAVVAMTMFAGAASAAQPSDSQTLLPPPWILPLAPPGYGGAGVVNPYSNVNPLNPMAAEMQKAAQGETTTTPAAQPNAGTDAVAPAAAADPAAAAPATFVELDAETEDLPDNVMMAPYPLIPAPSFAPVTVDTAALQAATYSFREALPQGADALPRNQRGELECLGCEWKQ